MVTNRSRNVMDKGSGSNSSFIVAQRTYELKFDFHSSCKGPRARLPYCQGARWPDYSSPIARLPACQGARWPDHSCPIARGPACQRARWRSDGAHNGADDGADEGADDSDGRWLLAKPVDGGVPPP